MWSLIFWTWFQDLLPERQIYCSSTSTQLQSDHRNHKKRKKNGFYSTVFWTELQLFLTGRGRLGILLSSTQATKASIATKARVCDLKWPQMTPWMTSWMTPWMTPCVLERVQSSKKFDFWQSMISYWWILIIITIPDWLMQYFRYQTLVQSQSRDLGLLRKQLEQSRLTTHKLRGIIEDLTRSDQLIDQRRFIQLARRTIRKLEGKIWSLDDLDLTLTTFDLDIIWPY